MSNKGFTHFNNDGDAHMVDIGEKDSTHRVAISEGFIQMNSETLALISTKGHKKGDVLQVARIAGIMSAKKTSDIIPLCHPIPITHINISFDIDSMNNHIRCEVHCETFDKTGIEMESLLACNICLLTIYDMCKSVDRGMVINKVKLLAKSGGKSGTFKS